MKRSIQCLLALSLLLCAANFSAAQDTKLKALQAAVLAQPGEANTHFNLGVEYFNRGMYEQALPELEKAAKMNSGDREAKELVEFTRGYMAYTKGNHNEALKGFQAALKTNPKNPNAAKLLGMVYSQMKEYGQAEKAFQTYVETFPAKDAQTVGYLNLGKIYLDQKRYPEAEVALQKVLTLSPKDFDALKNMGVVHFQTGDYTKAAAAWKRASQAMTKAQDPMEQATVHKYLGFSYYRSGALQEAIASYQKSLKGNPDDYDTLYNLGVAFLDNGAYDDASEVFRQAFSKNPNDSNAALGQAQAIDLAINTHMDKGNSFLMSGEYTSAINEWQKVLQYQPDHPEAQSFIAEAKKKMSDEVDKLYESGRASARAGQTLAALQQWNSALAMNPDSVKVKEAVRQLNLKTSMKVSSLTGMGDDALASGDYLKAVGLYRQALVSNPKSASIKAKLQKAQASQSAEYKRAFNAGEKDMREGKLRSAIQNYGRAVAVDPASAVAKQRLDSARVKRSVRIEELTREGKALFESGNKKEAQAKFNSVLALDVNHEQANDFIKKITGEQSKAKVDAEAVKRIYYEGVNLYINGKINEAIVKWQECLRLDPGNVNAQNNINKAKMKLQSIQKVRQG